MLRVQSIILTLLALAPAARPGDKSQAALPTEQLKALVTEYEAHLKEHEAVREAFRQAANDDDRRKQVKGQLVDSSARRSDTPGQVRVRA